jgi:hypothetical protein
MAESKGNSVSDIGIGGPIAAILSALKWHSFWWAVLHFFCGWFYVLYYLLQIRNS